MYHGTTGSAVLLLASEVSFRLLQHQNTNPLQELAGADHRARTALNDGGPILRCNGQPQGFGYEFLRLQPAAKARPSGPENAGSAPGRFCCLWRPLLLPACARMASSSRARPHGASSAITLTAFIRPVRSDCQRARGVAATSTRSNGSLRMSTLLATAPSASSTKRLSKT